MVRFVVQVFERETNREKNLEKAVKEAKIKARKEAAKTTESDKDRALEEQDIIKVSNMPLICLMQCSAMPVALSMQTLQEVAYAARLASRQT